MERTRTFAWGLAVAAGLTLLTTGTALWLAHARARDIGDGADVLGYDAAQYAVAARELAEHGRLATPFALPVELAKNARPPWPLALVQPGLVIAEATLFRIAGRAPAGRAGVLVLLLPFVCYLATALTLAAASGSLIARLAPEVPDVELALGATAVGLAFLLDPEAQHYATGGFTELPFALGLALALAALARGARMPAWSFGLLLGVTGLFRGNMLWLAPVYALAYAWAASRGVRVFFAVIAGYALVLAPWWFYKWRSFGQAGWDLSALSVWDGVGGRTWFSLNHLPQLPDVPRGAEAALGLERKVFANLKTLIVEAANGPRTLWIGGLAVAIAGGASGKADDGDMPQRARVGASDGDDGGSRRGVGPRAAVLAALATFALSIAAAAVSVPLFRYLAPTRWLAEAAGLVSVWAFVWNLPGEWATPRGKRILCAGLAGLALLWGSVQSERGMIETARVSADRGIPSRETFEGIAHSLDTELRPNEPVMSNLGPTLAWYTRRPVLHLALTPGDVDRCRERLEFNEIVLVFRQASRAWPGWDEVMARPAEATHRPEWNVRRVRSWSVHDGFNIVWLELSPRATPLAGRR